MPVEIILNRESQIILAEGHGRRWNFWNILALGILIGLTTFFITAWYALSRPIPIPSNTAILAVYSYNALTSTQNELLLNNIPAICKTNIPENANWPMICGITTSGESFAITPRWWNISDRTNHGLISVSAIPNSEKTKDMRYFTALNWRGLAKRPVIQMQSSAIESWLGLENYSENTEILFQWDGMKFTSNQKIKAQTSPLPAGDIAFYLDETTWGQLPGDIFLDASALPNRNQWNLPPIERFAIWFDDNRMQISRFIGFRDALDQNQAARILGMVDVTERRQIKLPDGSTSFERLLPTASSSSDLFGQRLNDRGQILDLTPRSLLLSSSSTTKEQTNISPCGASYPWLRLSSKALNDIIGIQMSGIQAYSDNGKLSICFEK